MRPERISKPTGPDGSLGSDEMQHPLSANIPSSRKRLLPKVASHLEYLATSFHLIDEPHRAAGEQLAVWIAERYRAGRPLGVVVVCTGNSRRSILGSTMGNVAAAYCGMPEIRFYSGGTAPTAFNARTITTLEEIGIEVEATGEEAKRGDPLTANPFYLVRWGRGGVGKEPALETLEFSKLVSDASNPKADFAALMVCSEADTGCPFVPGSSLRISLPYLDPKLFDNSPDEAEKYRERRDDIGRLLLSLMMRARGLLVNDKAIRGTTDE